MTAEEITAVLEQELPDAIAGADLGGMHPHVWVTAMRLRDVMQFLRDDSRLQFNVLRCVSGVDGPASNEIDVVYDLLSMQPAVSELWRARHAFAVKVRLDRANPHVPSVAELWPTADWHEREAYDLFGIVFDGHPDSIKDHDGLHPQRILCPDDWVGYPLRKDYLFPDEYHGIPGKFEAVPPGPG